MPAPAPRITKTKENPITKLIECRKTGRRRLRDVVSSISGPLKLARYTGTNGNTQGEIKDSSPALKAMGSDVCSIIYYKIMLFGLVQGVK